MLEYSEGTVFNAGAKCIVNTINTVGVMGAGLALEFALRYPEMLSDYQKKCSEKQLVVGKVDYFNYGDITILNFPTKWHFKYPSKIEWIDKGLQDFVATYRQKGITSIAFPRLGCSNGGLSWQQVQPLMEKYLGSLDIDVKICLDRLPNAEGKEKEMVTAFNDMGIVELSRQVRLTKSQQDAIASIKPIQRFWTISKIKGLGIKTYTNIFDFFYNDNNSGCVQMTIF